MAMVTLRLEDELNDRLTAAAKRTGYSKSAIIKSLLRANIDDVETIQSMEEIVAEYRKQKAEGTLETMTFDEFKSRHPDMFPSDDEKVRQAV